jgi:hypothetical protein
MKVINLEKDKDGIYKIPEQSHQKIYHHTKYNVHELIVENGEKLSTFLVKVNQITQTAIEISKIISKK